MIEFVAAQNNLNSLIAWVNDNTTEVNLNESDTRLKLINRLLFECFGWELQDCKTEERIEGKFIDYALYCPQCLLIVEAKREGIYFELPIGKTTRKQPIAYFNKYFPNVYQAIEQSMDYCQKHGTPYGAVCNGRQLIAFLAWRNDGRRPLDGKALVFDSLQSLYDDFVLAWNCLSKPGVTEHRLSSVLLEVAVTPIPEKLSKTINEYPGFKRRNELQTELQILSEIFIEDISSIDDIKHEKEFLKECYCESGALSQYALLSKELLKARYSAIFQEKGEISRIEPATTKKGLHPDLLAKGISNRPILLIGDRGVGKTIFIKHLYQVRAADILSHAIVFYIDFGHSPILDSDLQPFIIEEIKTQLLTKYNIDVEESKFVHGVLHIELERFNKSIYADLKKTNPAEFEQKKLEYTAKQLSDTENYLRKCLNHIEKGHKKQIVIFLDNIDQRIYEFQNQAFLIGESIAHNWPVTVFISIRPQTFYKSRVSGTIGAYHPKAFTIEPPRVDMVVNKRLNYGLASMERGDFSSLRDLFISSEKLKDYINVLIYSFQNNRHLIRFLDNMSGGNIRLALDFVRSFIGSGHVDTAKILDIYKNTGQYFVAPHEFLRAVLYGEHEYYYPDASEILNLFDISTPDGKEHFLAPILLEQLIRWSQKSTTDGFVPLSEIYQYAQSIGFTPIQVDWILQRLLHRNLIELPEKAPAVEEPASNLHFRITTVGVYYVKKLIKQFTYVDGMIVDTPILDKDFRDKIVDAETIDERLERAPIFLRYLDNEWQTLPTTKLSFSWPSIRSGVNRDIEYIIGRRLMKEEDEEEE
jgi:predicted type IV restriction endonuclease